MIKCGTFVSGINFDGCRSRALRLLKVSCIYRVCIYRVGDIYTCVRGRHIQREQRVICGDWRASVDPALPGVCWGVVGDMRHVDSVKSRVVAWQDRQMFCVVSGAAHSMCMG